MPIDVVRVVLPRLIFAGALAGLGLIAVNAPAWAEVLKRQGYYTDFRLTLNIAPQTVAAGALTHLRYDVESLGPDVAEHPVLILREDADIRLLVDGLPLCPRTGPQSVRCIFSALLPGQAMTNLHLPLSSHPDARGLRVVSGFVSAETSPTGAGPGLDVDATWLRLIGQHNTGMRLLDRTPTPLPDGYLRWTFELDNAGPSSVIEGYLSVTSNNSYRDRCRSSGGAVCPQPDGRVYLPPGSRIELDIEVAGGAQDASGISFFAAFFSPEGQLVGTRPQFVSMSYLPLVFSDGFEP
ncbi:hypothetical protein [Aquimonas sp.]|jgi:hypothetical protein|uniref:hypothetical protein n=1 Tax=Aquimonas sp. TaxID=1872588 RepID=UPI0037C104D5